MYNPYIYTMQSKVLIIIMKGDFALLIANTLMFIAAKIKT